MQVALTNIKHNETWVDAGDEVTQDDLDMTDEEWQALVDNGAVGEPTLTGAEAEAFAQQRLAEVDQLLQEKYHLSLEQVLATEGTAGEPVERSTDDAWSNDEGSPDGA